MTRKKKVVDWRKKLDGYFIAFCRRAFQWSLQRRGALALAFVTKGLGGVRLYRCASCRETTSAPKVDHVFPVCPISGWNGSWDSYRDNLWGGALQVLCKSCHDAKSKIENAERRKNRE